MHSLQLCVFATVNWVEIIQYSRGEKNGKNLILHFQVSNE